MTLQLKLIAAELRSIEEQLHAALQTKGQLERSLYSERSKALVYSSMAAAKHEKEMVALRATHQREMNAVKDEASSLRACILGHDEINANLTAEVEARTRAHRDELAELQAKIVSAEEPDAKETPRSVGSVLKGVPQVAEAERTSGYEGAAVEEACTKNDTDSVRRGQGGAQTPAVKSYLHPGRPTPGRPARALTPLHPNSTATNGFADVLSTSTQPEAGPVAQLVARALAKRQRPVAFIPL